VQYRIHSRTLIQVTRVPKRDGLVNMCLKYEERFRAYEERFRAYETLKMEQRTESMGVGGILQR
jgi:hypothetical protein